MIPKSVIDHDQLTTLWSVIAYHADASPDQVATSFEGRTKTYAELRDEAVRLSLWLSKHGYRAEDRVGYLGKNSDSYFVLLFAAAHLGAVIVPLNWRLAPEEFSFIVEDSTMVCLFSDEEFASNAESLARTRRIRHHRLGMTEPDGDISSLPSRPPVAEAIIFQVYTSGTTGRPKGAMLSNRNLLALRAPGYRAGLKWFPQPGCVVGQVLPVAHIAGTAYALFGFYAGAKIVISREFDAGDLIRLIAGERIGHLLLAPAAMQIVLEHPSAASADLTSLEFITYGAAPIPEALLRQAMDKLGCGFVQMYGMTEAAGGVVALEPEDHTSDVPGRLRSAGRAMPGVEIAIVDDNWNQLPADTIGEIVVRSAAVMDGYWNRADANCEVFAPNRWMRTGDIGRLDADGYVFVLDRAKDMIISGGENVYPAEVENAIFGHPDVADVAVVGAPSQKWGEEVVAFVVARHESRPELSSILAWLDGKLARYKLPKQLVLVDTLPRNAGNKVLRRELREALWQGYERRVN